MKIDKNRTELRIIAALKVAVAGALTILVLVVANLTSYALGN